MVQDAILTRVTSFPNHVVSRDAPYFPTLYCMRAGWRVGHGIGHHPPLLHILPSFSSASESLPRAERTATLIFERTSERGSVRGDVWGYRAGTVVRRRRGGGQGGVWSAQPEPLHRSSLMIWRSWWDREMVQFTFSRAGAHASAPNRHREWYEEYR